MAPADLGGLPIAPPGAQCTDLHGGANVARYRRARSRRQRKVWIEVVCPDGEGGWHPHRRLYHLVELEARGYGEATWDRAEIADDGSARVRHEGRWRIWRPARSQGRAPRRATNGRARGSRRGAREATGSGSRAGPHPDESDLAFDRFSAVCRELGLSPGQACELFHSLPRGAQQAAWDDLRRHLPTAQVYRRPGR